MQPSSCRSSAGRAARRATAGRRRPPPRAASRRPVSLRSWRHLLRMDKPQVARAGGRLRCAPVRGRGVSSGPMALLSIRNVTRRSGGIVAIDDVSLDVDAGRIVGLIGPNGAGKTTLFNVVTRLYKPDLGELEFDGKSLLRTPPHRIVRRGIARTFQNVELFRTMTVLDNVLVGAHTRTKPFQGGAVQKRAREVLDYVGIADVAN